MNVLKIVYLEGLEKMPMGMHHAPIHIIAKRAFCETICAHGHIWMLGSYQWWWHMQASTAQDPNWMA